MTNTYWKGINQFKTTVKNLKPSGQGILKIMVCVCLCVGEGGGRGDGGGGLGSLPCPALPYMFDRLRVN